MWSHFSIPFIAFFLVFGNVASKTTVDEEFAFAEEGHSYSCIVNWNIPASGVYVKHAGSEFVLPLPGIPAGIFFSPSFTLISLFSSYREPLFHQTLSHFYTTIPPPLTV